MEAWTGGARKKARTLKEDASRRAFFAAQRAAAAAAAENGEGAPRARAADETRAPSRTLLKRTTPLLAPANAAVSVRRTKLASHAAASVPALPLLHQAPRNEEDEEEDEEFEPQEKVLPLTTHEQTGDVGLASTQPAPLVASLPAQLAPREDDDAAFCTPPDPSLVAEAQAEAALDESVRALLQRACRGGKWICDLTRTYADEGAAAVPDNEIDDIDREFPVAKEDQICGAKHKRTALDDDFDGFRFPI